MFTKKQLPTQRVYLPSYLARITALHIHDNHGHTDEHLPPGDGDIDFLTLLKLLRSINYRGFLGIECMQQKGNYPGGRQDLATTIDARMARLLGLCAPSDGP